MNTKSIETLGFDAILRAMQGHCRSREAETFLANLGFLDDRALLLERQSIVGECAALLANGVSYPTFPAIDEAMASLYDPLSAPDGSLLVSLGLYIESARHLWEALHTVIDGTQSERAASLMGPLFDLALIDLERSIERDLDEAGQVRTSHPALVNLYRQIEEKRSRRTQFCRSFIREHSHLVQADQEALRDGRLVIPIRREAHAQVSGFVSSHSGSGSTLFMEPFALVEMNNAVVMAQNQILIEVAKILASLASQARSVLPALENLREQVGQSDGYVAIARWVATSASHAANLESDRVRLIEARHPLLGAKAVPITLVLDDGVRAVVFSGPNAGGKTVSIKTVGLFGMINQFCGYMPAKEASSLPLFDQVYCDIGDEQSIDDELSTFSGHMKQIASILGQATARSLILFDELGSGTDPVEGSAIAQAILEYAHTKALLTLVTSHHSLLKQYAYAKKEIINASMAFDEQSLEPTFTIVVGLSGESHGLDMARSMGLPKKVIAQAEQLLGGEQLKLSAIIKDLEGRRVALEERDRRLEKRRLSLQAEVKAVQLKELRLNQQLLQLKQGQVTSLERFVREQRRSLEELVADLRRQGVAKTETDRVKEAIAVLTDRIEEEELQLKALEKVVESAQGPKSPAQHFEVGMSVLCGQAKREGTILKKLGKGRYQVAIDAMKMTLKASDLSAAVPSTKVHVSYQSSAEQPKLVLDVRGKTLQEALEALSRQIESSLVHGIDRFSIIHGYGDGVLSRGIADYLKDQRAVKDYRFALPEDGGMGKTYVML